MECAPGRPTLARGEANEGLPRARRTPLSVRLWRGDNEVHGPPRGYETVCNRKCSTKDEIDAAEQPI